MGRYIATLALITLCSLAHASAPVCHVSSGAKVITNSGDTVEVDCNAKVQDDSTTGHADFHFGSGTEFSINVDCLVVEDTTAWLSGVVVTSTGAALIDSRISFRIVDNGEGVGVIDRVSVPVANSVIGRCEDRFPFPVFAVIEGNVQVKGACDHADVVPDPRTAARQSTWGKVKSQYR